MKLDRVTITGADDSVRPSDLLGLSVRYPFAEWGILVHAKGVGPRFPSLAWLAELGRLQDSLRTRDDEEPMKLSLHLCGRWVRGLLIGKDDIPPGLERGFDRIQLNFHAENAVCDPANFTAALQAYDLHQIIFQVDGANGNRHFETILAQSDVAGLDAVPLFDVSGGAGVLPRAWPAAEYRRPDRELCYHGYAGGLGPENLAEQIPRIAEAANGARFWIDMETRVRSGDDRLFDLEKVERCLEIAAPFVEQEIAA